MMHHPQHWGPSKLYTRKELAIIETYISDFHKSFCIPEIQKIAFHLTRVNNIGTNHCGNTRCESFKHCRANQDVLCHRDYAERKWKLFLHTKSNMNTMAETDLFLLK